MSLSLATVVSVLLLAPTANSATVSVGPLGPCCFSEFPLFFEADAGETNQVHVFFSLLNDNSLTGTWIVEDRGAVLTAGAGCTSLDAHTARCGPPPQTEVVFNAHVNLGDMNDVLYAGAGCGSFIDEEEFRCGVLADGGDGDDRLFGPQAGYGLLQGGAGEDRLEGGELFDDACWDCNRSELVGGLGDDTMIGANRVYDAVSYRDRVSRVVVSLRDGTGGDPVLGEHDVFSAVRGAFGGVGNDRIIGDRYANELVGRQGNDLLRGNRGADFVFAGGGDDGIDGGRGRDSLYGDRGDDTFWSRDGFRDSLYGGFGKDRAHRDGFDPAHSVESFF
jgi:hypothetical protein